MKIGYASDLQAAKAIGAQGEKAAAEEIEKRQREHKKTTAERDRLIVFR